MAGIEGIINIRTAEYRRCEVDGQTALFHRWNEYSRPVEPSPMIGGAPGGQVSYTLGLIEREDGTVDEVVPQKIRFLDTVAKMEEASEE